MVTNITISNAIITVDDKYINIGKISSGTVTVNST